MSFNYSKLRGRIYEKYDSMSAFATALGKSKQTVTMKMSGVVKFSQEDIVNWSKLLDISPEQYGLFFMDQS